MATTQNYNYPSSSTVTVTGIGTPNNAPIPGNSVLIAGENPSGNQTVIQTTASGDLITSQAAGAIDNVNLSQVGGATITEGQKTIAASLPVVIASDQSTLPISAASLPLPAGASTAALQTTGNTSLATIATNTTGVATAANQTTGNSSLSTIASNTTNLIMTETAPGTPASFALTVQGNASGIPIPVSLAASTGTSSVNIAQYGGSSTTLGIKASAASMPVVIASDQVVPISATSLPLPAGAATSANQTTVIANQTNGTALTQVEPRNGTLTDNSGTTSATPSTSTTVMASNASRRYLLIENVSTTATFWVNFTTAAVANEPSFQLLPGGSIVMEAGFVSTEAVTILSTVASVPYTAKQA